MDEETKKEEQTAPMRDEPSSEPLEQAEDAGTTDSAGAGESEDLKDVAGGPAWNPGPGA